MQIYEPICESIAEEIEVYEDVNLTMNLPCKEDISVILDDFNS